MTTVAERPRLLQPGLPAVEPGVERYRVRGGGATVVSLKAGDELTVVDVEGRQRCELTFLLPGGGDGAAAMGVRADGPARGLAALARGADDEGAVILAALAARGLDPEGASAVVLFNPWSPPGESVTMLAGDDVVCLAVAPGGPMAPHEQNPPSELRLVVRRERPPAEAETELPAPLAPPLLDFTVGRATAAAYQVKAGEYIQVIDVRARQCSDFMNFDR